jgi:glycosyltransferase involved in cell wall biosynthesis
MSTALDLSVIIPAYNEEKRIVPTLEEVDDFLAASSLRYEILVIDDGSSDMTVLAVSTVGAARRSIRVIATRPNRGKGAAVRTGMLAARGGVRLMYDADGSMPATEIPGLYNPVANGAAAVAIGSRYAAGAEGETQPRWRQAWSRLCNWFIQRTVVAGVADTQCGFKAFSAEAAEATFSRATIDGWAFDLEILALADRMSYAIREVSVTWHDDENSRVNPVRDFFGVVREWMAIRRNLRNDVYGLLPSAASSLA